MTDIQVDLLEPYTTEDWIFGSGEQFYRHRVYRAVIDGRETHRTNYIRPMIQLFGDGAGDPWRWTPGPPVDLDTWVRTGDIYDTDGRLIQRDRILHVWPALDITETDPA
jgi:hypothetical protein